MDEKALHIEYKALRLDLAAVIGAERFLAEIRTTAALQHPHILPLFDSGEADGFLFYVMPYVEGETVRDRLARDTPVSWACRCRASSSPSSSRPRPTCGPTSGTTRCRMVQTPDGFGNTLIVNGQPIANGVRQFYDAVGCPGD